MGTVLADIKALAPMSWIVITSVAFAAYLIGSVNFSVIFSKAICGEDIRNSGSGNAGATNMLRTHGKGMGALILLLDILKGVTAVGIALLIIKLWSKDCDLLAFLSNIALPYIAGFFVILGHNFPIFFGFRGGKGVATALGVIMTLNWKVGVIILITAIVVMAVTRYVSLGSVIAAVLLVISDISFMFFTEQWNIFELICVICMSGLVIVRHHANISRLKNGTERKLGEKRGE